MDQKPRTQKPRKTPKTPQKIVPHGLILKTPNPIKIVPHSLVLDQNPKTYDLVVRYIFDFQNLATRYEF